MSRSFPEVSTSLSETQHEFRDRCAEELQRILKSRTFSKSARLRSLLKYIGDCSLEERLEDLSEQQIGIMVFERNPGYNSAEDTIVRVTVRHLRERLDLYYREEGFANTIQISIPKGSYAASFRQVPASAPAPVSAPEPMAAPSPPIAPKPEPVPGPGDPGWPRTARIAVAACGVLALALLALSVYLIVHRESEESAAPVGPIALWKVLFTPGRKTFLVPGDGSLDAYVTWEQRDVSLYDYTNQNYQRAATTTLPPAKQDVPLGERSVTPMADLRLISNLIRVPDRIGEPNGDSWTEICYARDMVIANTHDANLILIGSETFNPWVKLYQPELDFYVQWDYRHNIYRVLNHAPKAGEQAVYTYDRNKGGQKPLTLLALANNSQGQGRVLLVEGTSMGTTYAAVSFLNNEALWKPVIDAATDSQGRLHNFEVLMNSEFVRGGVTNPQIVSVHIH